MSSKASFTVTRIGALLLAAAGCSSSLGRNPDGGSGVAGTMGTTGIGGMAGGNAGVAGTAGTTGIGGMGGGDAGAGGSPVNACLPATPVYPSLSLSQTPQDGQQTYDGPAVVERSVESELFLAFDPGGTTTIRHVRITNDQPMPLFTPGARVWLSKGVDPSYSLQSGPNMTSFAVRDRQGGSLLFGWARNSFTGVSSPVSIGAVTTFCTAVGADPCYPDATVSYGSVMVNGDTPASIRNGESGVVTLGGEAYDVRVTAISTMRGTEMPRCSDYHPPYGATLDVQARDVADMAARLEVGPPPACGHGNDRSRHALIDINPRDGSAPEQFEGPIFFKGVDSYYRDTYEFEIPRITPSRGAAPYVYIEGAGDLFPEPAVGQELWFSYLSSGARVLRESQQGPVLVATVAGSPRPDAAASLADVVGASVTLEKSCQYSSTSDLWDVVFATSPPVRVKSGTIGTLTLANRTYRVWLWVQNGFSIVVYPAT